MRLIRLVLVCLLLLVGIASAQQPVPISPTDAIGFDYLDSHMTDYFVSGFEVAYDGGPYQGIGIPASVVLPDTLGGGRTYKVQSPFATGTHTVTFRACNAAGCGGGSAPFVYEHVVSPSASPGNVRKVPR